MVSVTKRKPTGAAAMGPGPGRPKGSKNKVPMELRAMILTALDGAGGESYLRMQAVKQPAAFMALVGKCLPKDVNLTAKVSLADLVRDARARLDEKRGA